MNIVLEGIATMRKDIERMSKERIIREIAKITAEKLWTLRFTDPNMFKKLEERRELLRDEAFRRHQQRLGIGENKKKKHMIAKASC